MFDFIFKNKKGELQSYMDSITVDIKKLELSKLAINKAVGMIAHAIAKCEFIVQRKDGRVKDHIYWILNVRPNSNETATDFWIEVIRKLLIESECAICYIGGSLYIIDTFTTDNAVMMPRTYRNVTIVSNGETIKMDKTFNSSEIIHLKAKNEQIKKYLERMLEIMDGIASAISAAKKITSAPKFALDIPAQLSLIAKKGENGEIQKLTIDQYKEEIKRMLESDNTEVITNSGGMGIEQLKIETGATSEDIVKMAAEIFKECALAFDIPQAVFSGEITEKADSTNEFITYAVGWIVELINDSMNAVLVGEADYIKGENIWIDTTRYKHADLIESSNGLDKLRSIGFNFDELRRLVGWEELNTEFSQERVITKNYTDDLGGEKSDDE